MFKSRSYTMINHQSNFSCLVESSFCEISIIYNNKSLAMCDFTNHSHEKGLGCLTR